MKRTSFQAMACPLARALEHLSDSWNALILRDAFYGATRFDQFETNLGIASNTLTRRLKAMVKGGLLERRRYMDKPPRYEYLLTQKGRDLRPVMLTLLDWGNKHTTAPGITVELIDTATGVPVRLQLTDAVTGQRIGKQHRLSRRSAGESSTSSFPFPSTATHQADP